MPSAVGVPLIVIVFAAHIAVIPAGRPVGMPIPVAPMVVCVISAIAVFRHNVGDEEAGVTVVAGFTVTRICRGSPAHPSTLVSITCRLQVPAVVHKTDIRLVVDVSNVPFPPDSGIISQE